MERTGLTNIETRFEAIGVDKGVGHLQSEPPGASCVKHRKGRHSGKGQGTGILRETKSRSYR